ncbi:MAG: hypothetical protein EP335_00640 [Alphaproteobacteria bacterium]|nr:MAG: hypothetical protein EP335_00640 [Alphaproteobacteria bacterium]
MKKIFALLAFLSTVPVQADDTGFTGIMSMQCPFGVCMGALAKDFQKKQSPNEPCEEGLCLVANVPNPVPPYSDYSVVFNHEGAACGVIASMSAKKQKAVLKEWSFAAMYYSGRYGNQRDFDERTMTTTWTTFESAEDDDLAMVVLTIGKTKGAYLLTDVTTFKNIDTCQ